MHRFASKTVAGSTKLVDGKGALAGAVLTAGNDAATLIIYDNTEASGTVLLKVAAAAGTTIPVMFPGVVVASIGLYAAVTGTTPSATLLFLP